MRAVIKFLFLQDKAPKEIHAILTETLPCFLPGRAKDFSTHFYMYMYIIYKCGRGPPSTVWRFACGQLVALTVSVEGALMNYVSKYISVLTFC